MSVNCQPRDFLSIDTCQSDCNNVSASMQIELPLLRPTWPRNSSTARVPVLTYVCVFSPSSPNHPSAPSPHLPAFPPPCPAPPVVFFAAGSWKERQSLAGTAGCLGNTLCHRGGLEQELAYPCQSAGRIWAMPCVNRLSDFHSDSSGIGPCSSALWKSDPGQPLF